MASRKFGSYVRRKRLGLGKDNRDFSLRAVARAMEIEPSFLSKVERGVAPPPSEQKIKILAGVIGEDPDVLLAMAGKVSSDLQDAIRARPALYAELIRTMKKVPDEALRGMVKESRAKYGKEDGRL
jgi:transcriptional regulator with XRE-family HTH domain